MDKTLLPYDTIVKAAQGEPEAVAAILEKYKGFIRYSAYINGAVSVDMQDFIIERLIQSLPRFRFDR